MMNGMPVKSDDIYRFCPALNTLQEPLDGFGVQQGQFPLHRYSFPIHLITPQYRPDTVRECRLIEHRTQRQPVNVMDAVGFDQCRIHSVN